MCALAPWQAHDRNRTRAISIYLSEHRDYIVSEVFRKLGDKAKKLDKNGRRNEVRRLARELFHDEDLTVQESYHAQAGLKWRDVGVSGSTEASGCREAKEEALGCREAGEAETVGPRLRLRGKQPALKTARVRHSAPTTPPTPSLKRRRSPSPPPRVVPEALGCREVKEEALVGKQDAHVVERTPVRSNQPSQGPPWAAHFAAASDSGRNAGERQVVVNSVPKLRAMYGDSAAADTLAASFRLLDQFGAHLHEEAFWPVGDRLLRTRVQSQHAARLGVSLRTQLVAAAILGVAVKLVVSSKLVDKAPVTQLWSKVAGSLSCRVPDVEVKIINLWAKSDLNVTGCMM